MNRIFRKSLLIIASVVALLLGALAVHSLRSDDYVYAEMRSGSECYIQSTAGAVYFVWIDAPSASPRYETYWRLRRSDYINWEPYGVPWRPWLPVGVLRRELLLKESARIVVVQYWLLLLITSSAPLIAAVRYLRDRRRRIRGFSVMNEDRKPSH